MAKHIEREKVCKLLQAISSDIEDVPEPRLPRDYIEGWQDALETAIDELDKIPTVKFPFGIKRCKHQWETLKEIFPDSWGFGGKIILCCSECGKIKKVRI